MTSFNWVEYLGLARYLQNNQPIGLTAAALRSAVSRAYYAAFHHAEKWIYKQGHKIYPKHGKHEAVINDLKNLYKQYGASSQLKILKGLREDCDYEDSVTSLEQNVKDAISTSQSIINLLK